MIQFPDPFHFRVNGIIDLRSVLFIAVYNGSIQNAIMIKIPFNITDLFGKMKNVQVEDDILIGFYICTKLQVVVFYHAGTDDLIPRVALYPFWINGVKAMPERGKKKPINGFFVIGYKLFGICVKWNLLVSNIFVMIKNHDVGTSFDGTIIGGFVGFRFNPVIRINKGKLIPRYML